MSDLQRYLEELKARHEALQVSVSMLDCALQLGAELLGRLDQVARLEELTKRVRQWQACVVPDRHSFLYLCPARHWAVVGPGGVPDDVQVVGEGASLRDGEVYRPDLEGYRKTGKLVINGAEFLKLLGWLRQEVLRGRCVLPYHPSPRPVEAIPVGEALAKAPTGGLASLCSASDT